MVSAQSHLHNLNGLEALGVFRSKLEFSCGLADSKDTRLRGVDNGSKFVDAEHAEVGNGERAALVLFRLELPITSTGGKSLGLGRNSGKTLGTDVFDDGGNETVGGSDSDTDVGLLVRADSLTKPSRVSLGDVRESQRRSLDDFEGVSLILHMKYNNSLKSLTDSFVLLSPALLNTSLSFNTRSITQSALPWSHLYFKLTHVDFHSHIVMRQLLLAFSQSLANGSAHVRGWDILVIGRHSSGLARGGSGSGGGRRLVVLNIGLITDVI